MITTRSHQGIALAATSAGLCRPGEHCRGQRRIAEQRAGVRALARSQLQAGAQRVQPPAGYPQAAGAAPGRGLALRGGGQPRVRIGGALELPMLGDWTVGRPNSRKGSSASTRVPKGVDWNSSFAHSSSARAGLCWCCPRPERWSTDFAPLAVPICTRAASHLTGNLVLFLSRTTIDGLPGSLRLRAAKSDSVQPRRVSPSETMRLAFCSAVPTIHHMIDRARVLHSHGARHGASVSGPPPQVTHPKTSPLRLSPQTRRDQSTVFSGQRVTIKRVRDLLVSDEDLHFARFEGDRSRGK